MEWSFENNPIEEIDKEFEGFVYLITELDTGKKYIGKKFAWKKAYRKVNGKRKKVLVPSDWKTYYGSSTKLLANVALKGKENYKREIIYFCKTRGELAFMEAKEQFDKNVLLSDEYYNEFIGCKINAKSLRHLLKE